MEALLVSKTRNSSLANLTKYFRDVCLSLLAVRYKDLGRLAGARSGPSKPLLDFPIPAAWVSMFPLPVRHGQIDDLIH